MVSLSWWLNFSQGRIIWLSILLSGFYLIINAIWLGQILNKIIGLEKELELIFGLFLILFLVGFGLAIPIFFFKVLPIYLLIVLLFLTIVISGLTKLKYFSPTEAASLNQFEDGGGINVSQKWLVVFGVLFFLSLFFLIKSRTGAFILSPWQVIRPYYLYLWGLLTFILVLLIFSKRKIGQILLLIILASLLLHAYLPIVYQTGFGGDKWRHLGAERSLINGEPYLPVLFGEQVSMKKIGPIKIPEVLIVGNKNSYVNMWGLTIALSWLFGFDVFWIDLLLGYLLCAIFFPLLLFKFGQLLSRRKKFLLLLAFLPLCFSPFQTYGSITMPNSFGFLWFVFALLLIIYAFRSGSKKYLIGTIVLVILLSYFNYILYLILLLEIIVLAFVSKRISLSRRPLSKTIWLILLVLIIFGFFLVIPAADLVSHNTFKNLAFIKANLFKDIIDFAKRIFLSQPIFPRPFNMEQDNWLFTQVTQNLNRSIFLKLIRWSWILAPITIVLIWWGFIKQKEDGGTKKLFSILLLIILVNQFIATYFMNGNHIFNKRLVLLTAFLMMIFLALGLINWWDLKIFSTKARVVSAAVFLSLLLTMVYVSGPQMQTVTSDELRAAQYLWQKLQVNNTGKKYCVLANTWPLLALEGVSGRNIVTGGFPVYFEYAQPERVQLFDNINKNPSLKDINRALVITGASSCYVMTEDRWIYVFKKSQILSQLNAILGQPEKIGDVYLWHYQPSAR